MLQEAWHLPLRKLVARDAAHLRAGRAGHPRAHRPRLDRVVPGRRAALADRPGALVHRGHQPARAAADSPLAQPRVGAQRRPGAAGRAGVHGGRGRRRRLRLVAVRASGRAASGAGHRARGGVRGVAPDAAGRALGHAISPHQKALYALGVAFAAYGTATLPPEGNGFIAVFVAAIALGIWRPDIRECFEARCEDIIEIVKLGVFVVFGAIITLDGLFARRVGGGGDRGVHAAGGAAGRGVRRAGRNAAGGHGREGVHGVVRAEGRGHDGLRAVRARLGASRRASASPNIAALAVFVSIVAHGLTDHAGVQWIVRRKLQREVTHGGRIWVVHCSARLWQGARA